MRPDVEFWFGGEPRQRAACCRTVPLLFASSWMQWMMTMILSPTRLEHAFGAWTPWHLVKSHGWNYYCLRRHLSFYAAFWQPRLWLVQRL